jgi:hypothetical protein
LKYKSSFLIDSFLKPASTLHSVTRLLLAFAALSHALTLAAEELDGVPDYAYSVFVGTGKYRIDDRTIYSLRVPLEFDLIDTDYAAGDRVGLTLLVPVAIGVTDFDTLDDLPDITVDDLQTISFVPGLEVPVAMNDHWKIKPFAQVGVGLDAQSDSKAYIWGTGVRTRATYGEASRWIVGGEYLWAGNNPTGDQGSTRFGRLGIGAEYKIPTNWSVFDRYVSWHLRAIHWYFTDVVNFQEPLKASELHHSTEIGVSFGLSRPINILGYGFTQLGVGYERGDGFKAITFFTTFPF